MGQAELDAKYKRESDALRNSYYEQVGQAYAEVVGGLEQEEDEGYLINNTAELVAERLKEIE